MKTKLVFKIIPLLFVCLSMNLHSQTTYNISQEMINELDDSETVWFVEEKEIDYYPIIDTIVYSYDYQRLLNKLEDRRAKYEEYINEKKEDSIMYAKKVRIRNLISSYLTDRKNKPLLDEAHLLSEDIKLKISVKGTNYFVDDVLHIKQNDKYSSKKTLNRYLGTLDIIISNHKPVLLWGNASEYIEINEHIKTYPKDRKYETVKQPSKNSQKKNAYFVTSFAGKALLNGEFNVVYSKVYVAPKSEEKYQQNELTEECDGYLIYCDKYFYLLQNLNTKEYLITTHKMINSIESVIKTESDLAFLKSKNIKVIETPVAGYENRIHRVIETKNSIIGLSVFATEFRKDPSYSSKVDKFWNDYESLQNQIISYESQLSKYSNIWIIKGRFMSSSDINSWRSLTNKAILTLSKFVKLTEDNFSIYNRTESKKKLIGKNSDAVDMIIHSRNVLGL